MYGARVFAWVIGAQQGAAAGVQPRRHASGSPLHPAAPPRTALSPLSTLQAPWRTASRWWWPTKPTWCGWAGLGGAGLGWWTGRGRGGPETRRRPAAPTSTAAAPGDRHACSAPLSSGAPHRSPLHPPSCPAAPQTMPWSRRSSARCPPTSASPLRARTAACLWRRAPRGTWRWTRPSRSWCTRWVGGLGRGSLPPSLTPRLGLPAHLSCPAPPFRHRPTRADPGDAQPPGGQQQRLWPQGAAAGGGLQLLRLSPPGGAARCLRLAPRRAAEVPTPCCTSLPACTLIDFSAPLPSTASVASPPSLLPLAMPSLAM